MMNEEVGAYDKPCHILLETKKLLKEDTRSIMTIYEESGIPYFWLKKFSANEIKNPSVNRVIYLHQFLTNKDKAK